MIESASTGMMRVPLDDQGHLAGDVACIRCGYNLRTLSLEAGRCPECGLAVGRSVRGHWLCYCDPDWLARIWWGTNRFAVAVGCFMAMVGFIFFAATFGQGHRGSSLEDILIGGWVLFFTAGIAFSALGFWRATTPDPDKVAQESRISTRRLIRFGLLTFPVALGFTFGIGFAIGEIELLWVFSAYDFHAAELAFMIGYGGPIILVGLLLWYARGLTLRIPDKPLTWASTIVMVLFLICATPLLLLTANPFRWIELIAYVLYRVGIAPGFMTSPSYGWIYNLRDILIVTCSLCLLLTTLALIILLIWYWLAMKKQADWARRNWARQSTS